MTNERLADYMTSFENKSGSNIFEPFAANLEHVSMESLMVKSRSLSTWAEITVLVFAKKESVSLIFKQNIEAVDQAERARLHALADPKTVQAQKKEVQAADGAP